MESILIMNASLYYIQSNKSKKYLNPRSLIVLEKNEFHTYFNLT